LEHRDYDAARKSTEAALSTAQVEITFDSTVNKVGTFGVVKACGGFRRTCIGHALDDVFLLFFTVLGAIEFVFRTVAYSVATEHLAFTVLGAVIWVFTRLACTISAAFFVGAELEVIRAAIVELFTLWIALAFALVNE